MAEFVESHIQATIAQLEEIERIGLLSSKEIKILIQKRREFEYRLTRRSKNKGDFINSINYEKKLLELLNIRRKQIRIYEKSTEIESAIKLRVMKRCRFMTRYWPNHLDTWAVRISFARAVGWVSEVSIAYAEQVRFHGNRQEVYISWARFEIEDRGNFDVARKILLSKAPLYHRKSPLIKRELFRLELLYVESLKMMIKDNKEITEVIKENREKVLNCDVSRAVYRDSVKTIADPELYLEFYQVASKFSFAHDLREEIYRDLVNSYPNSECSWKLKAQRVVLGIEPTSIKQGEEGEVKEGEEGEVKEGEEGKVPNILLGIDKLNSTITIFDEALNAVGPSFAISFIEELLVMLYECWSNTAMMKVIFEKIIFLCQTYASVLLPLHYFIWFNMLQKQSVATNVLQSLLEDALKAYPDALPLQVEFFKHMLSNDTTDEEKLKEFNKVASSVKGIFGLQLWEEVVKSIKGDELKKTLFQRALNHQNDTVTKGLRVRYLEWIKGHKGLKIARKTYKEFGMRPPFSAKFHATMVMAELSQKNVKAEIVRNIFNNAILQHGKTHPGVWLSYIHFEKSVGNPLKAGGLYTRAENELEVNHAESFRQLNLIIRDIQSKEAKSPTKLSSEEVWVSGKDAEELFEHRPAVVRLFEEELILTYTVDQERKTFFTRINNMKNSLEKGNQESPKEDGSEWEGVMEHLLGQKVPLYIQKVTVKNTLSNIEDEMPKINLFNPRKNNKYELSDHLDPGKEDKTVKAGEVYIDKILESSLTLKPEFMKQKQLEPYFVGKVKAKAIRQKERKKTAGAGWFNMKTPELTEEVKRDIEILQMRPILDPKRPFKNRDLKVVPKYFQMGKILDSPADFYSSRITKKNRKRTMAEEILHDEDALRYQKRKYNEIIAKKQKQQHGEKKSNKKKKITMV